MNTSRKSTPKIGGLDAIEFKNRVIKVKLKDRGNDVTFARRLAHGYQPVRRGFQGLTVFVKAATPEALR